MPRASSLPTGRRPPSCARRSTARCGKRSRWRAPAATEETTSPVSATTQRPIAIYYEHPDWFRPLFQELDRRGVPYVRIDAADHRFDAGDGRPPYSLVFNRMSPSAYLRGHGNAIFYTLHYLAYLKRHDVRVINGYDAYVTETSKALQLSLLHHLGLPYPRAPAINHPARAPEAARRMSARPSAAPSWRGPPARWMRPRTICGSRAIPRPRRSSIKWSASCGRRTSMWAGWNT